MKWRKLPVIIEAEQHMGPEPLLIATLEGTMTAEPGDYIITGVEGEWYPCKPGIFRKTYELADERVEPAPSPQPEMPEGWEYLEEGGGQFFLHEGLNRVLSMSRIRALLATQGLTIAGPAERCTPAERKVLDAIPAWIKSRNLADGGRAEWALYEAAELVKCAPKEGT